MDPIPKEGVNEANLDQFPLRIRSILAEDLSKASLYYAEVSIEGDDQITKWTTPVDKEVSKNPKWHKERTIMMHKTNVHQKLVYVLVKIYEKGAVLDNCVGEGRVPIGEWIDYEKERFPLSRSKFQVKKAKGAIKFSCQIGAGLDEVVIASPAGIMTAKPEEIVTSSVDDVDAVFAQHAAPAPAYAQQAAATVFAQQAAPDPAYAQQVAAATVFAQHTAPALPYAQQAAPAPAYAHQAAAATVFAQQAAPATPYAQQAAPAATAFSGMTAHNLSYQPEVYSQVPPGTPSFSSYMPPERFSSPVNFQQGAPGFWYPPPLPAYYQPMPPPPPRANDLGVGAIAPLLMMGANMLGSSLLDVISPDLW